MEITVDFLDLLYLVGDLPNRRRSIKTLTSKSNDKHALRINEAASRLERLSDENAGELPVIFAPPM
jgi:hypothetical protein